MDYSIKRVELNAEMTSRLYKLDRVIFPNDDPIGFDGTRWWVAEDEDGQIVAYAGLQHKYGDRGFLCRAGVLKAHRGNGLQRRLLRARERGARSIDMSRLITYTDKENIYSSNNLIMCGYKLYRPAEEWGCTGALYWYRDL